jgi:hypothetical protein
MTIIRDIDIRPQQLDPPGTKTIVQRRRRIKRYVQPAPVEVDVSITEASSCDGKMIDKVGCVPVLKKEYAEVVDIPKDEVELIDFVVRATPTKGPGPTVLHLHLAEEGAYIWRGKVTDWNDKVSMDPVVETRWEQL